MMKSATRLIAILLVQLLTISTIAAAATIHVPANQPTIQAGIDAAADGDTVQVANGTYTGNGNRDIDFKGKAITLRGNPNDPAQVTIDCQQLGRGVIFKTNETKASVLDGIAIRNGYIRWGSGGAIFCESASPAITNCIITGNRAGYDGGGIYNCDGPITNCILVENSADNGGALTDCDGAITNCTITGNLATRLGGGGGGLSNCNGVIGNCTISGNSSWYGGGIYDCDGLIINCTINNNSADSSGSNARGGGFANCDGTISGCTISENFSSGSGGGMSSCHGLITNCTVTDNVVNAYGAGLHWCGGKIENCTVTDNSAVYAGGGFSQCNGSIYGCTITGNSAVHDGGGLFDCDGAISNCIITANSAGTDGGGFTYCSGTIINCTIVGNSAEEGYGLVSCGAEIANCIIWANEIELLQYVNCSVPKYSCIENWTSGGEGNISTPPLFIDISDTDPINWDLRLSEGSLCIDAGTNSPPAGLSVTDIMGNARQIDGDNDGLSTADMGAYEKLSTVGPFLFASKDSVDFEAMGDNQNPPSQEFYITNCGIDTLNWQIEVPSDCEWLSVDRTSGSCVTEQKDTITLSVVANGFESGKYTCQLIVSDDSAINSPQLLTVTLNIPEPILSISAEQFNFSALEDGANPTSETFTIANVGGGVLHWAAAPETPCSWLSISPDSDSVNSGEQSSVTLSTNVAGLEAGQYTCQITIADPAATNSPQTVSVNMEVIGADMNDLPASIIFGAYPDGPDPADKTFTVANTAGGTLHWTLESDAPCSWLSITPDSGSLTAGRESTVTLSVDMTGVETGQYSCKLTVSDPAVENSPQAIAVNLYYIEPLLVPSQYPTIQSAIDYAIGGYTIIIADGTYTGDGNRDLDFKGKAITVKSVSGPDTCIIDCQGTEQEPHRGFIFQSGETNYAILKGVTIVNGYQSNGGAVYCENNSNPTIKNCIFSDSYVSHYGGGLCASHASPLIYYCTFTGNQSRAGAIYVDNSTAEIIGCCIVENTSDYWSAGVTIVDSEAIVKYCQVSENHGYGPYGGSAFLIYGHDHSDSVPEISNCVITGNSNDFGNYDHGGTIEVVRADLTASPITNCTIVGNRAIRGGAVSATSSTVALENCILANNSATGSQIYLYNSMLSASYCNVEDMSSHELEGDSRIIWGTGNISFESCFADSGYWDDMGTSEDVTDDFWHNGDYHLKSAGWRWDAAGKWVYDDITSFCIDTGNPGMPLGDELTTIEVDPDNNYAINKRINMGAYGGTAEASMAPTDRTLLADINNDHKVNTYDLAMVMESWLTTGTVLPCDLSRDSNIDYADFTLLAAEWQGWVDILVIDPVAHWPFDIDGSDSVGENFGTLKNGASITSAPGEFMVGLAGLKLDGIDDSVRVKGYKGIAGTAPRTVSAWIKTSGSDENMAIVSWGTHGVGGSRFLLHITSNGTLALKTGGDGGYIESASPVDDAQWHHVALTMPTRLATTGEDVKLYVDGFEQPYSTRTDGHIDTGSELDLNVGSYNGEAFFDGFIDDVRIYDYQLTDAEIADLAG